VAAPQAYYQTASPDESFRIATTAMETWTVSNFPMPAQPNGCMSADVDGVHSYLAAWAWRERPGARVLDVRDRPDLAAPYAGLHVDDPTSGLRIWVEAGEITYAFEHRGVAVEERLATVIITVESLSRSADGSVLGYQARTAFGHVVRAPAGQLGTFATLADTVLRLVRVDPQWQAAIDAHLRRLAGDRIDTAVAIHPVANGPVELPDYFDFVWRLEDGSYRFTNDALIVPFRDWGLDGQIIERMP
jgi:hypothetical protein